MNQVVRILEAHLTQRVTVSGMSEANSRNRQVQKARLLKKTPSLKRELQSAVNDAYADALYLAIDETGLPEKNCHKPVPTPLNNC